MSSGHSHLAIDPHYEASLKTTSFYQHTQGETVTLMLNETLCVKIFNPSSLLSLFLLWMEEMLQDLYEQITTSSNHCIVLVSLHFEMKRVAV